MNEALLTGAIALLVWFLSRFPAFTARGRLASRIEADLRIAEKLTESQVRSRLVSSIEADVERMLDGRERMEMWASTPRARAVERVVVAVAGACMLGIAVWVAVILAINWPQRLWEQVIALGVVTLVLWQFGWVGVRAIWRALRNPAIPQPQP